MQFVRSDSPEVAHSIASARALACWGWSIPTLVSIASAPGLLIILLVSVTVSVRTAAWFGVPVILALNGYLFWRGRSPRLNWVVAAHADRFFVRVFARRGRGQLGISEPNVIVFEASEIASISIRTVEVFVLGPKPKSVEWMVLEPFQAVMQDFNSHVRPFLKADDPGKQVYITNEEGRLTMEWKWCRPALPVFLRRVARECPSVVIAPEDRSELDLNGIWHGFREEPNAEQRGMLHQAMRLGFGSKCVRLLSLYRFMPLRDAAAYLMGIEQEEAGTGPSAVQSGFLCGWRP